MDWLQFFSSLAWPAVALIVIYLIRKQLARLAGRMEELTLPGGVSAKFGKELDENREKVEELRISGPNHEFRPGSLEAGYVLAETFPEAAVLESFKSIEDVIVRNRLKLPAAKGSLLSYVKLLHDRGVLSREMVGLFRSLRNMRNLAAHGGGQNRITPGEAAEYGLQCETLAIALEEAFKRL